MRCTMPTGGAAVRALSRTAAGSARTGRVVAFLLLAALCAGCAGVKDYAENRARDLADIVRGHVMAGVGIDVKLEATTFVALGFGGYDAWAWGLGDRYFGTWHESVYDFAVPGLNHHEELRMEGVPRVSGSHDFNLSAVIRGPDPVYTTDAPRRADWFTLRATVFCFVGVDVELRLGEVIDFVAGIFGGDPSADDGEWPPPAAPSKEAS